MRKAFKLIMTLSVLLAFSFSAILCCCAMHSLHSSAMMKTMAMTSEPYQKDSFPKETTHHGYCFLQAPAAEKVTIFAVMAPSLDRFVFVSPASVAFEQYPHQFSFVPTAYGGLLLSPAQFVPLYLQTHSLRL